ncbi:MAG: hypothetical protein JW727_03495 [Candidatus Aenigmarchaeota archaeon]|nr:hypothetical protein [Candidatus Aenigmarchaeota archaeon]
MDKAFRDLIGITGIFILVVSLILFVASAAEFYKFLLLFSVGVVLLSIRIYNFPGIQQFLVVGFGWVMGIYALSSIFTQYSQFPVPGFEWSGISLGVWCLAYPALLILYEVTRLYENKKWHETSIAALDAMSVFGAAFLAISAIACLDPLGFSGGITGDWREFYVYGVALLLYTIDRRGIYLEGRLLEWNTAWRNLSGGIAFLGGLMMIWLSISSFLGTEGASVPVFLAEAVGGVFVCFVVYQIFQREYFIKEH